MRLPAKLAVMTFALLAAALPAGTASAATAERPATGTTVQAKDLTGLRDVADRQRTASSVALERLHTGPPATRNAVASPFAVWVDNQSPTNRYDLRVYYASLDVSGVQQTGGSVGPGQSAPYVLGGPNGCATVYAYVLEVYWNGVFQGNTGVVQPDGTDGAPCADAWGLG